MFKIILILLLIILFVFFFIKNFKNNNFQIKHLFILLFIAVIFYFIYTGKISYLLPFIKNILPNILKIIGI